MECAVGWTRISFPRKEIVGEYDVITEEGMTFYVDSARLGTQNSEEICHRDAMVATFFCDYFALGLKKA
jgi:hypothetical protein